MFQRLLAASVLICTTALTHAETVNIYSFRQGFLIEPILQRFTEKTGIETKVVYAKKGLIERIKREGKLSPADVVLTSNFSKLIKLKDSGLIQPFTLSNTIKQNIPTQYRDSKNQWVALTMRARSVYSSRERLGKQPDLAYEDLSSAKFKGRICTRSGKHPYNLGLIASLIAHHGEATTEKWLRGVKANLARKPQGNDRAQVKAIKEGLCDVSLGNSYYLGKMLNDQNQVPWAAAVYINFPNQKNRGTHVNVSGAVLAKYAPNKAAAQKLIEFLTSQEAQGMYAQVNYEYPINPRVKPSKLVSSWGKFKADTLPLEEIAKNQKAALKLVDKVGFDL